MKMAHPHPYTSLCAMSVEPFTKPTNPGATATDDGPRITEEPLVLKNWASRNTPTRVPCANNQGLKKTERFQRKYCDQR
jgi:hypothetical protein